MEMPMQNVLLFTHFLTLNAFCLFYEWKIYTTYLSKNVDDSDGRSPSRSENVWNDEIDSARLNVTSFADADGGENGDENKEDAGQHDQEGVAYFGLAHDPTGSKENDNTEDVDQARR